MTSTAPWWGIPVLAGSFAFFGVLLAQGVALWIDRRKRRDEAQRRWDRERQARYVEFSTAAYDCLDKRDPKDVDVSKELVVAERCIQLVASKPVAEGARAIVELFAANAKNPNDELSGEARGALDGFNEAVRIELGILAPTRRFVLAADSIPRLLLNAIALAARATLGVSGSQRVR